MAYHKEGVWWSKGLHLMARNGIKRKRKKWGLTILFEGTPLMTRRPFHKVSPPNNAQLGAKSPEECLKSKL
jgi:hypothetical protein